MTSDSDVMGQSPLSVRKDYTEKKSGETRMTSQHVGHEKVAEKICWRCCAEGA